MTATFRSEEALREDAILFAMAHEGGLVDHKKDPGGITQWGVSLRHARNVGAIRSARGVELLNFDLDNDGDIDADDIRALTKEQAKIVYVNFWQRHRFKEITSPDGQHRKVVMKFYDLCLPMGYGGASRVVQRTLNTLQIATVEDGFVGPISRTNLNEAIAWNPVATLTTLMAQGEGYFRDLDAPDFEKGWVKRARHWP